MRTWRKIYLAFSLMAALDEILGVKHVMKFGRIQRKTIKIRAGHVTLSHGDICWLTIKKLVTLQRWQCTCKGNLTLIKPVGGQ